MTEIGYENNVEEDNSINNIQLGNVEAEMTLLGIILMEPEKLDLIELDSRDFYVGSHKIIFSSITRLASLNLKIDVITVYSDIDEQGELENVGGLKYLGSLTQIIGCTAHIKRYAEIIKNCATARKLQEIGFSIKQMAGLKGESLDKKIGHSMSLLNGLIADTCSDEPSSSKDVVLRTIEYITNRANSDGINGIPTGIKKLDNIIGGFMRGQLIIIAGRPSMGKTSLSMQSAENAAKSGYKPLVFSLEMSEIELMERMLASNSKLGMGKIKSGRLTDLEYAKLSTATSIISDLPIRIVDKTGLSVDKIRSIARRHQMKYGLDMIVIDQLGHIPTTGYNLAQDIGKNTSALKRLAKDFDVPVVVVAQLNRESAKAGNVRRPTLTDLRDSGSIEQDADVVLLIHREGYYDERCNPTEAEIIVAKQRQGVRGISANVGWNGKYTMFTEEPDHSWVPSLNIKQINNDGL